MIFPCPLFRLEVVDEIASTNEALLARRSETGFDGQALLAHNQTRGVGRRGRQWQGGRGNLFLSVGLRLPATAPVSLLPFLAGLALHDLLAPMLPEEVDLRLKWPNDIYLCGDKLAGLLTQARQAEAGVDLVLGLGLNLREAPPGLPAVALASMAIAPVPEPVDFAEGFLEAFGRRLRGTADFPMLREAWERAARLEGTQVEVVGEPGFYRCRRLLESGELEVVDAAGHERRLASEEVSLRLLERPER